jgi:hypothetical protein
MQAFLSFALFLLSMFHNSPVQSRLDVQPKPVSSDTARIKDYGLKPYLSLSKDLPYAADKPWKLVCQMPYNCHFQPWIELESPAGKVIELNSSNPLVLYLTKTESFTTSGSHQVYEAKNWISGEGAVYSIPAGVKVKSVQYRETGYQTAFAGSFECNDEDYNVLWKKGARTAYLCMRDWFYDCPDRERVGFWGDGTPELNQCFYAFDQNAHQLCKNLVLRPLDSKFYPGQQLEFLGEYGLWYYYLQTGDSASLKKVYPNTKAFLFDTYKFGKKNQWYDWGKENKDVEVLENCFMYIDLKTLKKMAILSGNSSDTAIINTKLDNIKSTFNQKYWKGQWYQSAQVLEPDDRANAMAINAGLAEASKWESIYTHVLTQKTYSSCFFDRWVFEALCTIGHEEYALLRMYKRYKTMIPASFSTLWEHYDRWWASHIDAFDDASSLNHGWNPPVINLSQTIAGITPVEPGWASYQVLPKEAFLNHIKVRVPSIKGNVDVELSKTSKSYQIKLHSPLHTQAIVGIPKKSFTALMSIQVNGETIWQGTYQGETKGISWIGEDKDYLMFKADPGVWDFLATGTLPISSPKPLPTPVEPAIKLSKKSWKAYASVKDSLFLFSGDEIPIAVSAENAIDGDHWTGWRDMTKKQYPGQWFLLDLQRKEKFDKIELDNTWALWDSPNKYQVSVSNDGKNWSPPIAEGKGELGITHIVFPPQNARYVKVSQTGSDPKYNWSIYEIDLYRRK